MEEIGGFEKYIRGRMKAFSGRGHMEGGRKLRVMTRFMARTAEGMNG